MQTDLEALTHLCDKKNKVSSHFFINKVGKIYKLVDPKFRAWHAGISFWKGEKDINSNSIGIEISNSGYHLDFEKYDFGQITSLINLLLYLKKKYNIDKNDILGHSDIAPYRKIDPGEKFPWYRLEKKKIIYLPKKIKVQTSIEIDQYFKLIKIKSRKSRSLYMLNQIGYDTSSAKQNNKSYKNLIKAYQMHYNNECISGKLDIKTYEIIKSHFNQTLTN
tara:strand:- start:312 stop:971 length:660 start_codon:yes stop_codon:yes gene_type:complete